MFAGLIAFQFDDDQVCLPVYGQQIDSALAAGPLLDLLRDYQAVGRDDFYLFLQSGLQMASFQDPLAAKRCHLYFCQLVV